MKTNEGNFKEAVAVSTGERTATFVLRFDSVQTPGAVYDIVVDQMDKAVDVAISLASPEMLRALELKIEDYKARVKNAESKLAVTGRPLERPTFEDTQPEALS